MTRYITWASNTKYGKISLPMLNDVTAAGLTPEALAADVAKAGAKLVRDAGATVIVK